MSRRRKEEAFQHCEVLSTDSDSTCTVVCARGICMRERREGTDSDQPKVFRPRLERKHATRVRVVWTRARHVHAWEERKHRARPAEGVLVKQAWEGNQAFNFISLN